MQNIDSIAEALATQGWSVVRKFVSDELLRELGEEAWICSTRARCARPASVRGETCASSRRCAGIERSGWIPCTRRLRSASAWMRSKRCGAGAEPRTAARAVRVRGSFRRLSARRLLPQAPRQPSGGRRSGGVLCALSQPRMERRGRRAAAAVSRCVRYERSYRDVLPEGGTLVCFPEPALLARSTARDSRAAQFDRLVSAARCTFDQIAAAELVRACSTSTSRRRAAWSCPARSWPTPPALRCRTRCSGR